MGGRKANVDSEYLIRAVVLAGAASLAACASVGKNENIDYGAMVASPDRSEADRQTDQRRNPELLLAFTGVRPGMRVLDMGAGGGYSTELLARAVGCGGKSRRRVSRSPPKAISCAIARTRATRSYFVPRCR